MEKFLTVQEVADQLRVHRNTVYTLVQDNKIENFRISKSIRFTEQALKKFLAEAKNDSQAK